MTKKSKIPYSEMIKNNSLNSYNQYTDSQEHTKKEIQINKKFILDACCGPKHFWFDKNHPNTLYMDIRKGEYKLSGSRGSIIINPDIQGDFTNLPEEVKHNKYKLIVWDVPHFLGRKQTGDLTKTFGTLNPETWQDDLKKGFKELWNVLDDYGVLLFKFSDYHIKFDNVLKLFSEKPLFYNKINSKGVSTTKWFCFMKIPKKNETI